MERLTESAPPALDEARRDLQRAAQHAVDARLAWDAAPSLKLARAWRLAGNAFLDACTPDVILALCAALEAGEADTRRLNALSQPGATSRVSASEARAEVGIPRTSSVTAHAGGRTLREAIDAAALCSNGTTAGHEPDVLPQGMTFHAGELGDAYVAGAKSGRDRQPTDEQIGRACDAYVKHAHLIRLATPPHGDDRR